MGTIFSDFRDIFFESIYGVPIGGRIEEIAAKLGYVEVNEDFIKICDSGNILHSLLDAGLDLYTIQIFVNKDNINFANENGETPLTHALRCRRYDVVEYLTTLDMGANFTNCE